MWASPEAVIRKWLWWKYQESPELGYQCVAWAKKFAEEIWYPLKWFSGSALKGWQTWSPFGKDWIRVENGNENFPKEGDIVFLDKTKWNPYGHVWVVGKGSTFTNLVIVEQNALTWNGGWRWGDVITCRNTRYNDDRKGRVLGWYTLAGKPTPKPIDYADGAKNAWIWNGDFPDELLTRNEAWKMFTRASKKNEREIWSMVNPNTRITPLEINFMSERAFWKKAGKEIRTRKELAIYAFQNMKK